MDSNQRIVQWKAESLDSILQSCKSTAEVLSITEEILLEYFHHQCLPRWTNTAGHLLLKWNNKILEGTHNISCAKMLNLVIAYAQQTVNADGAMFLVSFLRFSTKAASSEILDDLTFCNEFWKSLDVLFMAIIQYHTEYVVNCFEDLASDLMSFVVNPSVPILYKAVHIKQLNEVLKLSPMKARTISKANTGRDFKRLPQLLKEIGDYDIQACIVETILRMSTTNQRSGDVSKWFPSLDCKIKFLFTRIADFDPDCRRFLNAFNNSLGSQQKVFSIPCEWVSIGLMNLQKPKVPTYEKFWIDFNYSSSSILILCERSCVSQSPNASWENLSIRVEEVKSARLMCAINSFTLEIAFRDTACVVDLFASQLSQDSLQLITKCIVIEFATLEILIKICPDLFQDKLEVVNQNGIKIDPRKPFSSATDKISSQGRRRRKASVPIYVLKAFGTSTSDPQTDASTGKRKKSRKLEGVESKKKPKGIQQETSLMINATSKDREEVMAGEDEIIPSSLSHEMSSRLKTKTSVNIVPLSRRFESITQEYIEIDTVSDCDIVSVVPENNKTHRGEDTCPEMRLEDRSAGLKISVTEGHISPEEDDIVDIECVNHVSSSKIGLSDAISKPTEKKVDNSFSKDTFPYVKSNDSPGKVMCPSVKNISSSVKTSPFVKNTSPFVKSVSSSVKSTPVKSVSSSVKGTPVKSTSPAVRITPAKSFCSSVIGTPAKSSSPSVKSTPAKSESSSVIHTPARSTSSAVMITHTRSTSPADTNIFPAKSTSLAGSIVQARSTSAADREICPVKSTSSAVRNISADKSTSPAVRNHFRAKSTSPAGKITPARSISTAKRNISPVKSPSSAVRNISTNKSTFPAGGASKITSSANRNISHDKSTSPAVRNISFAKLCSPAEEPNTSTLKSVKKNAPFVRKSSPVNEKRTDVVVKLSNNKRNNAFCDEGRTFPSRKCYPPLELTSPKALLKKQESITVCNLSDPDFSTEVRLPSVKKLDRLPSDVHTQIPDILTEAQSTTEMTASLVDNVDVVVVERILNNDQDQEHGSQRQCITTVGNTKQNTEEKVLENATVSAAVVDLVGVLTSSPKNVDDYSSAKASSIPHFQDDAALQSFGNLTINLSDISEVAGAFKSNISESKEMSHYQPRDDRLSETHKEVDPPEEMLRIKNKSRSPENCNYTRNNGDVEKLHKDLMEVELVSESNIEKPVKKVPTSPFQILAEYPVKSPLLKTPLQKTPRTSKHNLTKSEDYKRIVKHSEKRKANSYPRWPDSKEKTPSVTAFRSDKRGSSSSKKKLFDTSTIEIFQQSPPRDNEQVTIDPPYEGDDDNELQVWSNPPTVASKDRRKSTGANKKKGDGKVLVRQKKQFFKSKSKKRKSLEGTSEAESDKSPYDSGVKVKKNKTSKSPIKSKRSNLSGGFLEYPEIDNSPIKHVSVYSDFSSGVETEHSWFYSRKNKFSISKTYKSKNKTLNKRLLQIKSSEDDEWVPFKERKRKKASERPLTKDSNKSSNSNMEISRPSRKRVCKKDLSYKEKNIEFDHNISPKDSYEVGRNSSKLGSEKSAMMQKEISSPEVLRESENSVDSGSATYLGFHLVNKGKKLLRKVDKPDNSKIHDIHTEVTVPDKSVQLEMEKDFGFSSENEGISSDHIVDNIDLSEIYVEDESLSHPLMKRSECELSEPCQVQDPQKGPSESLNKICDVEVISVKLGKHSTDKGPLQSTFLEDNEPMHQTGRFTYVPEERCDSLNDKSRKITSLTQTLDTSQEKTILNTDFNNMSTDSSIGNQPYAIEVEKITSNYVSTVEESNTVLPSSNNGQSLENLDIANSSILLNKKTVDSFELFSSEQEKQIITESPDVQTQEEATAKCKEVPVENELLKAKTCNLDCQIAISEELRSSDDISSNAVHPVTNYETVPSSRKKPLESQSFEPHKTNPFTNVKLVNQSTSNIHCSTELTIDGGGNMHVSPDSTHQGNLIGPSAALGDLASIPANSVNFSGMPSSSAMRDFLSSYAMSPTRRDVHQTPGRPTPRQLFNGDNRVDGGENQHDQGNSGHPSITSILGSFGNMNPLDLSQLMNRFADSLRETASAISSLSLCVDDIRNKVNSVVER